MVQLKAFMVPVKAAEHRQAEGLQVAVCSLPELPGDPYDFCRKVLDNVGPLNESTWQKAAGGTTAKLTLLFDSSSSSVGPSNLQSQQYTDKPQNVC